MAESVTITDNRTGESVEIPISNGGVDATEWSKLLPGVWFHDPSFSTTAAASSSVTELDGENGILRYRGYPIEQLAENSTYLEVAYLLLHGELPDAEQFAAWEHDITYHTFIHENVRKRFMEGFHHDAHPMGILVSTVAALSTFYPAAKDINDPETRDKQIVRLIAKMPTIAAGAHRHSVGMPFVYPDNELDFCSNFLSMMWKVAEPHYEPDPVLSRALDVLFILHADHEQNCSTTAMRVVGSSHADPYSATAAAAAALYGPRHGGANEAVIRMLTEIGSIDNVEPFIASVKEGKGRLQGFGHRVYKNYDPRAKIIKQTAYDVFDVTGKSPLLDIALKLEEVALSDDYFVSRKLYPNVDFYSGPHLPGHGLPHGDVHRAVRHPPHLGLAVALDRDAQPELAHRPVPASSTPAPRCATTSRSRTASATLARTDPTLRATPVRRDGPLAPSGRRPSGAALLTAGTGHLTFQREEFQAQVPPWVPLDPDVVVLASGVVELALGAALVSTLAPAVARRRGRHRRGVFVAVFPGHVASLVTHRAVARASESDTPEPCAWCSSPPSWPGPSSPPTPCRCLRDLRRRRRA